MWQPTHKLLTYEFLSSLSPCQREDRLHLSFLLRNATYYLDYTTFCTVFDFSHESIPNKQLDNARELWPKIAGRLVYSNRNICASDSHHPVLRMFFKFSHETLFPSPSPHLVRNQEVHILHRYLAPHADTTISIPMTLWKFLNTTTTLDVKTELCIGGHVYRIAELLKVINPVEFSDRFANQTSSTSSVSCGLALSTLTLCDGATSKTESFPYPLITYFPSYSLPTSTS